MICRSDQNTSLTNAADVPVSSALILQPGYVYLLNLNICDLIHYMALFLSGPGMCMFNLQNLARTQSKTAPCSLLPAPCSLLPAPCSPDCSVFESRLRTAVRLSFLLALSILHVPGSHYNRLNQQQLITFGFTINTSHLMINRSRASYLCRHVYVCQCKSFLRIGHTALSFPGTSRFPPPWHSPCRVASLRQKSEAALQCRTARTGLRFCRVN